jgi:primosomal protein N' (replication factor Y) (superfamily II helicase)
VSQRAVSVALPVPLYGTYVYTVEERHAGKVAAGSRVVVEVRGRRVIGVVVAVDPPLQHDRKYQAVLDAPDDQPSLTPAVLATCKWISSYYAAPPGLVLRAALPALLTGPGKPAPEPRSRRIAELATSLATLVERDAAFRRSPKQREVFELLESLGGRVPTEHLEHQLGVSPSVITSLVKRGFVKIEKEVTMRDAFARRARVPMVSLEPTDMQRAAIDTLTNGAPGDVFLLHGVTGSGKTLVYIELLRHVVERVGKTAIVLVPEIALTPQTVDRFRGAFGDKVAVLHSALSDGERLDAWRAIRSGQRPIVVGARSAIFAPLTDVGAIIVDEEHEASYKQGETPRYHARDVAIVRARTEGGIVVLGSATPSLESWANAQRENYKLITLPDRVGGGALPRVQVVDMRIPAPGKGMESRASSLESRSYAKVFSEPLDRALRNTISRGEQAILLLNRRGFAAFVQCGACGDVADCPNCSISLTAHRTPERLICHYCGYAEPLRVACAKCGGPTVRERGMGTQQVEKLLLDNVSSVRIARMDVDTTSARWAHADILDRVARREVDVLLGTQMIAKGLDFPNVTLVGVIDSDVGLNLPDFRAAERSFQLMAQVAGRAGRGPKGGLVFIQTRLPGHHAVRTAVEHDYRSFVSKELMDREFPPYPPTVRLANIVVSGTEEVATMEGANRAAEFLTRLISGGRVETVHVIGPAPCPVERIKSRWRWHVLLRARRSAELTRVLSYFATHFDPEGRAANLRVVIDRDPVTLL